MSHDIGDTCRRSSATAGRLEARPCRKPVWSSPPSSSSTSPVAEVAARYGVSQGWVCKLMARYRAEGEAAFEPRSRRPKTSPARDPSRDRRAGPAAAQAAHRGRAGRRRRHHRLAPDPPPPDHRVAGHDPPDPDPRRAGHTRAEEATEVAPTSGSKPRCRTRPGSPTSPTTGSPPDGTRRDIEILTWLDDCSRYALHVTAHRRVTGPIVLATFREAVASTAFRPPP